MEDGLLEEDMLNRPLLRGMWDLPGSGIESVSPELAGGFFTTESPGKPQLWPSDGI